MKTKKHDDGLLSELAKETCEGFQDEIESNSDFDKSEDLRDYFEKRLNEVDYNSVVDYLVQQKIESDLLHFQDETKCYRMMLGDNVLDFPSNWSVFELISSKEIILLDNENDNDFLIDVFSELKGNVKQLLVVTDHRNKIRVVYIKDDEIAKHLKWFEGYFQKHNSIASDWQKKIA